MPRPKKNHAAGADTKTKRVKANADAVFSKKEKKGADPKQTVLPDLSKSNGPNAPTLMHHIKTIKGYVEKKDEAVARIRNARQQAKDCGVDLKALDLFFRLEKTDPLEAAVQFKQLKAMCQAAGVEVQVEMFDGEQIISPNARAYDDGLACGRAAKDMNWNSHALATRAGQLWVEGWHDGQQENIGGITQAEGPGRRGDEDDGDDENEEQAPEPQEGDGGFDGDQPPGVKEPERQAAE